jgi:uncharacterized protein involved in exopolysaccharide biosynthesis
MLQAYSAQGEAFYEGRSQSLGLGHVWGILKRRAVYCVAAFSIVLLLGAFITAIQTPIYEAQGKVLVQSQEIPTDLVRPTVTQTANERIQVIEQRIMTRDNLLGLVNKYKMFVREQQWMSQSDILDLMRERTQFELVDIKSSPGRPGSSTTSTIAFTIKFQYQNPEIATRVTNDILTLMLSEDARNRTNSATETTAFLTRESQRLQGELAAIEAQIVENRTKTADPTSPTTDPSKLQIIELTKLKEELAQKSSTYSAEYPGIKALKKKIAAMEQLIAQTPSAAVAQVNSGLFELQRQELATQKSLEETNKKLEEARLGEKLERDQQSERLQVIEQPVQPQKPIKPNKIKLLSLSLALAMAAGAGAVFAAESLDKSIKSSRELLGVANGRLVVSIPYIATRAETFRRRSRFWLLVGILLILVLAGVVGFVFFGPPIDPSWINQFALERLTGLTK